MSKFLEKLLGEMDGKKTISYAILTLLAGFIPGFKDWLASHPTEWIAINSAIVAWLRTLTKKPLIKSKE